MTLSQIIFGFLSFQPYPKTFSSFFMSALQTNTARLFFLIMCWCIFIPSADWCHRATEFLLLRCDHTVLQNVCQHHVAQLYVSKSAVSAVRHETNSFNIITGLTGNRKVGLILPASSLIQTLVAFTAFVDTPVMQFYIWEEPRGGFIRRRLFSVVIAQ